MSFVQNWIPGSSRQFTGSADEVVAQGDSVYLGEKTAKGLEGLDTPVTSDVSLSIIPAMACGGLL